jgi:hypothetical protein
LFSLETGWAISDVIGLTRKALRYRMHELTPIAFELAQTAPRHIKLDYVFWEFMSTGAAAPLFGLEETALEVSRGIGIDRLRVLYRDAAAIDSAQAAAEITLHFAQTEALLGLASLALERGVEIWVTLESAMLVEILNGF